VDKGYQRGEMERIALAIQNSDMRSDLLAANQLIEQLQAEVTAIRAAGDALAESYEWVALHHDQIVDGPLIAWKEARRG